jgi:hypothetical protein
MNFIEIKQGTWINTNCIESIEIIDRKDPGKKDKEKYFLNRDDDFIVKFSITENRIIISKSFKRKDDIFNFLDKILNKSEVK